MVSSYLAAARRRYRGQLDEDADEFIDFAVDGAARMRALIEELLAYSRGGPRRRARAGRARRGRRPTSALLAAALVEASATIEIGELPIVMADRAQLGSCSRTSSRTR